METYLFETGPPTSGPNTQRSVHGRKMASGTSQAAECADCHGIHDIRKVSDPASPASTKENIRHVRDLSRDDVGGVQGEPA